MLLGIERPLASVKRACGWILPVAFLGRRHAGGSLLLIDTVRGRVVYSRDGKARCPICAVRVVCVMTITSVTGGI